jgi:general secretion pathway protein E
LTPGVRKLIMDHSEAPIIKEYAIKEEGMTTLLQDGLQKAIEGITTVEEVLRVS